MDHAPVNRRRWLRFSLRTLLVVVTLAAVASWVYWIGWPWWQAYWEQARFETAVKQLKVGMTTATATQLIALQKGAGVIVPCRDAFHHVITHYVLQNGVYYIQYKCPKIAGKYANECPSSSIEVFRFRPIPSDYKPRSEQARRGMPYWAPPPSPAEYPAIAHWYDVKEFIVGDRTDDYGLQHELIHSDPPANPKPH